MCVRYRTDWLHGARRARPGASDVNLLLGVTAMHRPTATLTLITLAAFALAACADTPTAPRASARSLETVPRALVPDGEGDFHRYVAIGTSVSQGWRSDGVNAGSQQTSWPAQLARLANRELSLPLIAGPGCGAPLMAPLGSGLRIGGESAAAPFLSRVCAANEPGVTLPAGNVAISGARTGHALNATPETPDPNYAPLYARVLPPGMSQVSAMEAQNRTKAALLYGTIDSSGFYRNPVEVAARSWMNVPFTLPTAELDKPFLEGARKAGLVSLEGHRSVGGMRASIYNAMPLAGVQALVSHMHDFQRSHG